MKDKVKQQSLESRLMMDMDSDHEDTSSSPSPSPSPSSRSPSPEGYSALSPSSSDARPPSKDARDPKTANKEKHGSKRSSFACRIRDHVKMGPKFSETVKGKLSLGAKIIQEGGRENIFKQIFGINDGEKLLKASQCYLSTTSGPIAGLIFISNAKIAFCSERSLNLDSLDGQMVKVPYKVLIPTKKIKEANQSENMDKPEQKYIHIITNDDFEFWFMGFLRYEKAWRNLEKAISMAKEV